MKRILAWILSWIFYLIGDTACFLHLWSAYSYFMGWSVQLQTWGNAGPWGTIGEIPKEVLQDLAHTIFKPDPDGKMIKSDECWQDRHDDCDGFCLDSPMGCECECHFEE